MMMKFILKVIVCLTLLSLLAGCESEAHKEENASTTLISSVSIPDEEVFSFDSGKAIFTPGSDPSAALQAQGKPLSVYKSPSCALPGTDIVYTFSGFVVSVNEADDGTLTLTDLYFTDDSPMTEEGLTIGASVSDIKKMYEFVSVSDSSYISKKGNTELVITFSDDTVTGIDYRLTAD